MNSTLTLYALLIVLLPLAGAILVGLGGVKLGRRFTHLTTILFVAISFFLSCYLFKTIVLDRYPPFNAMIYTWATANATKFNVTFLLDQLSVTMMVIVLFVSLMVHIYTIGYMEGDPGYSRFFSYVSLFTFFMLTLVIANNFLLLFFGWEGVGLVSYLLIGFWFNREAAVQGGLKAFLVNRVGDIAFLLGIAAVFIYFKSINYYDVFSQVVTLSKETIPLFPGYSAPLITTICLLLFIGAMAKSAQVPMHVWLPESMEGPTPISALIHAATMVTAGIYMIARMSPLFEYSPTMLSVILVIGGTTAFFMGLVALVQDDIKRVIAYSTISQLGYMAVALGASAYDAAIFHLITHAFFKALLFLAAGSVIIALHHEQNMRKMGGLATYLPVTYLTFAAGALALCAIPPFSGFYSKDIIIEAVHLSHTPGAQYAYYCVLFGAFVTSLYTFRALFMTFHGPMRVEAETRKHLHESPWVVTVPLILLAIPSIVAGQALIDSMLFAPQKLLGNSIFVLPNHDVLAELASEYKGFKLMALEAGKSLAFWLSLAGIFCGWLFTLGYPYLTEFAKKYLAWPYHILLRKYGLDELNQVVFVQGTQKTGQLLYNVSEGKVIDGAVNGSGKVIRLLAQGAKFFQTGYLYHYAFVMVIGILLFLVWMIWG